MEREDRRMWGVGRGVPRGTVILLALTMVSSLAVLSLLLASRIVSTQRALGVDIGSAQCLDLAQSALDWNMNRAWRIFRFKSDGVSPWAAGEGSKAVEALRKALRSSDSDHPATLDTFDKAILDRCLELTGHTPTNTHAPDFPVDWMPFGGGEVQIAGTLADNPPAGSNEVFAVLRARARVTDPVSGRQVVREIRRLVRFSFGGANKLFEFAYFMNNFGWLWGNSIYIQGNMGANANISFKDGPTVNGYLYAAVNSNLAATGSILDGFPKCDTIPSYLAKAAANPLWRPTNPAYSEDQNRNGMLDPGEDVNGNGTMDFVAYPLGYGGSPQQMMTGQLPLNMPYLGDLEQFKQLAQNYDRPAKDDIWENGAGKGGYIKQLKSPGLDPKDEKNWNVLVDKTYGFKGDQKGLISFYDGGTIKTRDLTKQVDPSTKEANGNVALIGTPDQPLVICGPVVVSNDLVIKGTITGQGTIYTGRNIHVVGDVNYRNPPSWAQNDQHFDDPGGTHQANNNKDIVSFCSKGSVIFGQYYRGDDYWSECKGTYFKTGFQDQKAQSYQVDPTDERIGYVTGTYNGNPCFHGDYTKAFGTRFSGGTETADKIATLPRAYFESSFSNEYIQSIIELPGKPTIVRPAQIHGIFYANHLIGGRVGMDAGVTFLGALIGRDEGIIYNNVCNMIYDPRASELANLGRAEVISSTTFQMKSIIWEERDPGQSDQDIGIY